MISVALPVRDGERFLEEAIHSILGQTLEDLELLVVDDGSTDATPDIAHRMARSDPRIRVIRLPPVGRSVALNVALAEARSDWVARMDADDVAHPERLEQQLGAAQDDPAVVVWASWAETIDADGRVISEVTTGPTTIEEFREAHQQGFVEILHPTVLMRRDVVLAAGGYDASLELGEDIELWDRVGDRGPILTLPQRLLRFRVHTDSHSTRGIEEAVRIHRYVAARRAAAAEGRRIDLDGHLETQAAKPAWRRWAARRDTYGRILHRRAGVSYAEGQRLRGLAVLAFAVLVHPRYVIPRIWRQVIEPRLRRAPRDGSRET